MELKIATKRKSTRLVAGEHKKLRRVLVPRLFGKSKLESFYTQHTQSTRSL